MSRTVTPPPTATPVPPASILPGATTGVASNLNVAGAADGTTSPYSNSNFTYTVLASAVQDYLSFHGSASSSFYRNGPSGFEYFQTWATGSVTETLTIPSAPVGVPFGSIGQLMLGWTVTGSVSQGAAGTAYMSIFAHTSPSLPNTHSNTVAIHGNGHYDLVGGMSFFYDTPFTVTIESSVFAAVGYDYSGIYSPAPSPLPATFSDTASADFLHTAILTTASALNGSGNPLPGLTINTSSGLPFPLTVPEPATLTVLMLGVTLGIARRRYR
ncbi:MAG: PEP-CTERM sorting domain-containing protein [Phycisphaerales bacterium]